MDELYTADDHLKYIAKEAADIHQPIKVRLAGGYYDYAEKGGQWAGDRRPSKYLAFASIEQVQEFHAVLDKFVECCTTVPLSTLHAALEQALQPKESA